MRALPRPASGLLHLRRCRDDAPTGNGGLPQMPGSGCSERTDDRRRSIRVLVCPRSARRHRWRSRPRRALLTLRLPRPAVPGRCRRDRCGARTRSGSSPTRTGAEVRSDLCHQERPSPGRSLPLLPTLLSKQRRQLPVWQPAVNQSPAGVSPNGSSSNARSGNSSPPKTARK